MSVMQSTISTRLLLTSPWYATKIEEQFDASSSWYSHGVKATLNRGPNINIDAVINITKSCQNSTECIQGNGPEQPFKHGE